MLFFIARIGGPLGFIASTRLIEATEGTIYKALDALYTTNMISAISIGLKPTIGKLGVLSK